MPSLLHAGEYGPYIYPAYALSALVVGWLIVDSLTSARRWRRKVEERKNREDRA